MCPWLSSRPLLSAFALAGVVWVGGAPVGGLAQAPPEDIEVRLRDAELEYDVANSEWETTLSAFRAAEARFQRAIETVNATQASGDSDAYESALARAQREAILLQRQEVRELEAREQLAGVRTVLMETLALSRDRFYQDAIETDDPRERRDLAALYEDRDREYRQLERESAPPTEISLVVMPELMIDVRDGPDELNMKIGLMELRIRELGDDIKEIDDRVRSLEKRQRQERDMENLVLGVERFDDTFLPVTSPDPLSDVTDRDRQDAPAAEDASVESLDELSLEDQIERLQLLKEQMFDLQRRMEIKAATFRLRLERMTTS